MKYIKTGLFVLIGVIACLYAFQESLDMSKINAPLNAVNQEMKLAPPKEVESSGDLQPIQTQTNQDNSNAVKSKHDRQLAALNNLEFEQYEKGNIDFRLLRLTQVKRNPPPIYPEELSKMDGKTVKILGFMAPYDDIENMKNFMLFPTIAGCFFCAPPSAIEVVLIRQKVEKAKFIYSTIVVEGTLSLWKEDSGDEGHKMFLYIINDAKVTNYTKG